MQWTDLKLLFAMRDRNIQKFRKNRLPSPALSDEESAVDDSDTDEFGYCPIMLNLENDDPEVEDVFGAAYAQRIRGRSRQRAPAIRPQKVFSPPPKEESRDTPSEQKIVEKREAASSDVEARPAPRRQARKVQYSAHLRKDQKDDRNILPPEGGSQLPAPRPSRSTKTPEMGAMDECNTESSLGQRFTRQGRQQIFYELDRYGKLRLAF
ncbi:hypothetical protein F5883DRAFT_646843 [Diaporthe sp. PMI_573]|nr:hypothetical protein F5883DRAFT_646843 [Diaporthaceae sp. PMI_573]